MGKDLKGKELGVGISQRKDGLYTGRFTTKGGQRKQKYFKKLQECRKWIAETQYQDEHGDVLQTKISTVDAWYKYWIDNIKGSTLRASTKRRYQSRYRINVQPLIGNMLLDEIKPLHCQNILNHMKDVYTNATIQQARTLLCLLFESAVENELIIKTPVTKLVKCTSGKKSKDKRVLTIGEQKAFLGAAKGTSNYNKYALILQTGLRVGELTGLNWNDIDFEKKILYVRRSMDYVYSSKDWVIGETKSKAGYRTIPLTQEALSILKEQKRKIESMKIISIEFSNFVFLNKNGTPTKRTAYRGDLARLSKKAGIEPFSIHTLRHTFATRCIEAGMRPKTLQIIMGHSSIKITMDMYVHVTEEEKVKELERIEDGLNVMEMV